MKAGETAKRPFYGSHEKLRELDDRFGPKHPKECECIGCILTTPDKADLLPGAGRVKT